MVSSRRDWYDPRGEPCRHGFPYGDCPARCGRCGHRCELHGERCYAVECPCEGWLEEDDEEDPGASEPEPW